MSRVAVTVNGEELLASGSITTALSDSIEIQIDDLTIALIFQNDDGATKVSGTPVDGKRLPLVMEGFANRLGTSWKSAVGTLNNRPLILGITVYLIGTRDSGMRVITYSLTAGAIHGEQA